MRIEILAEANEDLIGVYNFYEKQAPGLGSYFLDTLFSEIDSLLLYAGTHPVIAGTHRSFSRRFPFAIYYRIEDDTIRVRAVLDCCQNPNSIRRRTQAP